MAGSGLSVTNNLGLDRASTEESSSSTGSVPQTAPEAAKAPQTKLNTAVQQVKDICSHLSNALGGNKTNKTIMGRVAEGFMAVAALGPALAKVGVLFAQKNLDKLVEKKPVLAMAAGVAGVVFGGLLCSVEPFSGIALTTAAAYTILNSYKPVHDKLMAALDKSKPEPEPQANSADGQDPTKSQLPDGSEKPNDANVQDRSPSVIIANQEEPKAEDKKTA